MELEKFPERLKKLRKRHKLHQKDLAKALNVERSLISKLECGERKPTLEHIIILSQYFDINMAFLCGLDDYQSPFLSNQNHLVQLTKNQLEDLYMLIGHLNNEFSDTRFDAIIDIIREFYKSLFGKE